MIALALLFASTSAEPTPRAFVEMLYANYEREMFSPFERRQDYFDPRLVKAMQTDAVVEIGTVGELDYDPLCRCQDPDGMIAQVPSVRMLTPTTAVAKVAIRFPSQPGARRLSLRLTRTPAGWRISDVRSLRCRACSKRWSRLSGKRQRPVTK